MFICKYCKKECKNKKSLAQHERTCPNNANRIYKNGMLGKKGSNHFLKARENSMPIPECKLKGRCGRKLTTEQKIHLSEIAKIRKFGGYEPNAGNSKKFFVIDSFNTKVCLQSSYELECSHVLNELGIKWLRPKALKYDDRNYFADFYLPEYKIYLDPKNAYKAKCDAVKIQKVKEQNNIKLFVLLKEQITKEYIGQLIGTD